MKKTDFLFCFLLATALNTSSNLNIPRPSEEHGPFTPIIEQYWSKDDLQAELEKTGILARSIRIEPSLLMLKVGDSFPVIQTFYESTGQAAKVDYEILAPHHYEKARSRVDKDGKLYISYQLNYETEFMIRARLRDNPEIFDDLMVTLRY